MHGVHSLTTRMTLPFALLPPSKTEALLSCEYTMRVPSNETATDVPHLNDSPSYAVSTGVAPGQSQTPHAANEVRMQRK